jgi:hypothetical protein
MNPKDPYELSKFDDRNSRKRHSVAAQRHEKRATRHPHTILGAIAPDAAPGIIGSDVPVIPKPAPPHHKPVDEILQTALPAEQSYSEAAIVAQSAFKPRYVAPGQQIAPIMYGSPTVGAVGDASNVVPHQDYDMSLNKPAGSHQHSSNTVAVLIIVAIALLLLVVAVVVLVSIMKNK